MHTPLAWSYRTPGQIYPSVESVGKRGKYPKFRREARPDYSTISLVGSNAVRFTRKERVPNKLEAISLKVVIYSRLLYQEPNHQHKHHRQKCEDTYRTRTPVVDHMLGQLGHVRVLGEDDRGLLDAEPDNECTPAHQHCEERAQQISQWPLAQPPAGDMGIAQLPKILVLVDYTALPG